MMWRTRASSAIKFMLSVALIESVARVGASCPLGSGPPISPSAAYLFTGNAEDIVGSNHGVVSGVTLTDDRFGSPGGAYVFNGQDKITIAAPWDAGDKEFSVAVWIKPTAGSFDGNWHAFIGYNEAGTRSPNMWLNHAGNNCNPVCGGGPGGGNNGNLNEGELTQTMGHLLIQVLNVHLF